MTAQSVDDVAAAARRWADFFETLTPESLNQFGLLCAPDIHFKDPFNDVCGVGDLQRIFDHMFATVDSPAFSVTDIAVSGATAYLRWGFSFRPKGKAVDLWQISGVSEVAFDQDMKVISHIDYWDAGEQFYGRLPFLGRIIHWVRSKLSAA